TRPCGRGDTVPLLAAALGDTRHHARQSREVDCRILAGPVAGRGACGDGRLAGAVLTHNDFAKVTVYFQSLGAGDFRACHVTAVSCEWFQKIDVSSSYF